jgi:hypothetical protein
LREAAHLWDRAAERETDARRRVQYTARAAAARAMADAEPEEDTAPKEGVTDGVEPAPIARDSRLLN